VTFTVPNSTTAQVTQVNYGLNSQSVSGTWSGAFTAGSSVTQTISGLTNGTSYVVYVQAVNSAGLTGAWSNASNQVTPFGQPGAPNVSATANGTQITFSWSGGGGSGRPVTSYNVCIDGTCTTQSGPGNVTNTYAYGQTHSVYASAIDSTGWSSQASSTASATTPPPPSPSVTIADSGIQRSATQGTCSASYCHSIEVTASNFPPNVQLSYSCYASGTLFFGPSSGSFSGSTTTDGSGNARFESYCIWGFGHNPNTATVTVTGGGQSATSNGIQ
jgi:predicted CxxxxCH...CXXCH cytochrome family protein